MLGPCGGSIARRTISHCGFEDSFAALQPEGINGLAENLTVCLGYDEPAKMAKPVCLPPVCPGKPPALVR